MPPKPKAKKPTLPDVVSALLATHKKRKTPLHYHAPVKMFAGDLEVELDATGAGNRLDDDETERPASQLAIGFFSGLPLVVETAKAKLPVIVYLEGLPVAVAPSFDTFAKNLGEPRVVKSGPKKGDKLVEPETMKGYTVAWPTSGFALVHGWPHAPPKGAVNVTAYVDDDGDARNPFLWVEFRGKNADLYRELRDGKPVADRWESRTEKFDRGTGHFLDVAWYRGGINLPVVTPRVRAMLETLALEVEYLPIRVSVNAKKADYFIVHPLRLIDCLDPKASKLSYYAGNDFPEKLVFKKVPADAHLFRIATFPQFIVASSKFIDVFRKAELSGLDFTAIEKWDRTTTL